MKKLSIFLFVVITCVMTGYTATAQLREIPAEIKNAFSQQYPDAQNVNYDDKLIFVLVHFSQSDSMSTAKYDSKGIWQWTETAIPITQLPSVVQDGFNKSKYADWQLDHVFKTDYPGKVVRYKLQVEKSAIQKRNLFYSEQGRLISDNLTLY